MLMLKKIKSYLKVNSINRQRLSLRQPLPFWWSLAGAILVAVLALTTFAALANQKKQANQPLPILTNQNNSQVVEETKTSTISGDRLEILKLNIKAPIIFDVSGTDEKAYLKALEDGVAQMAGSARPSEVGNVFIFGHSQYYKLKPGNYKEVFKELDKLVKDDQFSIFYQNKEIKYKVTENKVVKFDDWSIQDGPTPKDQKDKTITIMTCWPPGTIKARRAVFAVQI